MVKSIRKVLSVKAKEQVDRSETFEAQVLGSHEFNEARTVGFQIYRTKRPKENIGWVTGAAFLFLGVILSLGRLTVIGQFLDDVLFNLPWGWLKFPLYLGLLAVAFSICFNYHFKFKKTFILMSVAALSVAAWMMSLAVLTALYNAKAIHYDLNFNRLWDRDIFIKSFKLYWLNWKDYSVFATGYAQTSKIDLLIKGQGYVSLYGAGGALGYLLASASYYLSLPGAYVLYSAVFTLVASWLLTGDFAYFFKTKPHRHGRALRLLPLAQKNKPNEDSPLISTKVVSTKSIDDTDQFLNEDLLTLQHYDDAVSLRHRQSITTDFSIDAPNFNEEDSFNEEETLIPEAHDLLTTLDDELPLAELPQTTKKPTFASAILQTNLNQKITPHFHSRREPIKPDQQLVKVTNNDIPLAKLQQKRVHRIPQPQATRQAQSDIYNQLDPQEARRLFERETSVTPFGKLAKTAIFQEIHWPNYQIPSLSLLDGQLNQILDRQYNQSYADQIVNHLNFWLTEKRLDASCKLVAIGEAVARYQFKCGPNLNPLLLLNQEGELKNVARVSSWRWDYNQQIPNPLMFEIPNQTPLKVPLKEVLQGIPFDKQNYRLLFALGKRLSGELLTANLASMPHVLLAGHNNKDKTMVLSNLIASLLMRNTPDEVKLVLFDSPSKELINFAHLPHLLTPFITNGHHIHPVFEKLLKTMDQRAQQFSSLKVKTIEEYNKHQEASEKLPYLVIIVNELHDLQKNLDWKLIESKLKQLIQLGPTFGLHFVIATTDPEVTLLNETLIHNCPARIALQLPNARASVMVLNQSGAEQLSGHGDLLFAYQNAPKLIRAQGVYLSSNELKQLLTFIYQQIAALPKEEY